LEGLQGLAICQAKQRSAPQRVLRLSNAASCPVPAPQTKPRVIGVRFIVLPVRSFPVRHLERPLVWQRENALQHLNLRNCLFWFHTVSFDADRRTLDTGLWIPDYRPSGQVNLVARALGGCSLPTNIFDIEACVFDAYGTLFDVNSAARAAESALGEKWQPLADLWRAKQLQYTWLRSLGWRHADFWQVTGEALDFALATLQIENPALRAQLMNLYMVLSAYPEVPDTLKQLKAAGMKLAILSNGSPTMLAAAAGSAGIAELLDAVLSVEEVKIYKPHPAVYGLACKRFNAVASRICFVSSNGWDAYSAKAFGFRVVWCNRLGQAPEQIPETPDAQISTLAELPGMIQG